LVKGNVQTNTVQLLQIKIMFPNQTCMKIANAIIAASEDNIDSKQW